MSDSSIPSALRAPRAVREIAETLESAGFEAWCVGGAVRDALAGEPHLDWDFATSATPPQVQALFRKTIPIGIEHGTVAVRDRDGVLHEITTFRHDVRTDGRHAVVQFGASLEEDLARRDFTMNAIAYSPTRHELRDPFHGQKDLERRVLRAVGVPSDRMREDWLRALRALRFAGRFSMEIEPATWAAVIGAAPNLTRLSAERVKQEIEKTMEQVQRPSRSLLLWRASGALQALIPALAVHDDTALKAPDYVATPEGAARPERVSLRKLVRLASFFGGLDAVVVRATLRGLRFSNRDVDAIEHIAATCATLQAPVGTALGSASARPSDAQLRRWAATTGRTTFPVVFRTLVARLGGAGALGEDQDSAARVSALYRRGLRIAYRDPISVADLAIDGGDLQEMGIAAGPMFGEILRLLLERVLDDPSLNTRTLLLAMARALAGLPPDPT
jgi:tRNA nucleotidyltransferase (CCA-adding enzyme)